MTHGPACICCNDTQLIPTINAAQRKRRNPLRADPSRTNGLRRRFLAEVNKRFRELDKAIRKLVVEEDAFGLKPRTQGIKALIGNESRRWAFLSNDRKVEEFGLWLQTQLDAGILSAARGEDAWTAKYVNSAYKQGLLRSFLDTNRTRLSDAPASFYAGSQSQFLQSAFGGPESVSKLRLLYSRSYEDLKNVSSTMANRMRRVLTDGLGRGDGVLSIAKELSNSLSSIGINRARTIARTEIIHAHSEGQLDGFEELGVEEVGVMAEWSTAGDERVCPVCAPLEGSVMTIKEARGLIPRHPNCRCTWIPANVGENEKGQKRTKSRLAKAIKRSMRAEASKATRKKGDQAIKDASRWAGADRKISGKKKQPPLGP